MAKFGVRLFTQAAILRSPRALHYVRNAIDGIDNVTLHCQPRSPVSVGYVRLTKIRATFPRVSETRRR